jgi:hypothetical protein
VAVKTLFRLFIVDSERFKREIYVSYDGEVTPKIELLSKMLLDLDCILLSWERVIGSRFEK